MTDSANHLHVNQPLVEKSGNIFVASPYFESYLYDISLISGAVTDISPSVVAVASPDATDLATAITLVNEIKADVNALVVDLNAAVTQVNLLLTNLRASGKLSQ